MRLHFSAVNMANVFRHIGEKYNNHWDGVLRHLTGDAHDDNEQDRGALLARRAFLRWQRLAGQEPKLDQQMAQGTGELFPGWSQGIMPRVEGRVKQRSKKRKSIRQDEAVADDPRTDVAEKAMNGMVVTGVSEEQV